jgi:dienelactone hydrolase
MNLRFECPHCGAFNANGDDAAGKAGECRQCGQRMTIPQAGSTAAALDQAAAAARPPGGAKGTGSTRPMSRGRTIGILVVLVLIGLESYNRLYRGAIRQHAPAAAVRAAENQDGPIETPPLPQVGPGREIEPGVMFHEVQLPAGEKPGFGRKLWLYLPASTHAEHSLPCVLITGAGSNLLRGMNLGDGDRPEHLPYVRAGFAVLAYELDGAVPEGRDASEAEMSKAIVEFLAARAGLINAHIALEFVLQRVPQVDPGKIYVAGHSSAATAAMLFAEHEPAIHGCVVYAPAINLAKRFGPEAVKLLHDHGFDDLVVRHAPMNHEAKLSCPILLFHARDDGNLPVADTEASAQRLKALGKSVTLVIVPSGGHYDSMINEGIPCGIAWLQELAGPAEREQ